MASETWVEQQEELESKVSMFGNAQSQGQVGRDMLEMSATNRLIAVDKQAHLLQAWETIYNALVARDNLVPKTQEVLNKDTGELENKIIIVDNWRWMVQFGVAVQEKQLTMNGYSRQQHLGVATAAAQALNQQNQDKKNWLQGLFG
jgi:hypothetical protein